MPTYKFYNHETREEFIEFMGITEADNYLRDNPHIEKLVHGAPMIGYSTVTKKPDESFRQLLKHVNKRSKGAINSW